MRVVSHFVREKDQVGAAVYVEGSPDNVRQLRSERLPTISFANSTNTKIAAYRAKFWEEVYDLVHQYWSGKVKLFWPRSTPIFRKTLRSCAPIGKRLQCGRLTSAMTSTERSGVIDT